MIYACDHLLYMYVGPSYSTKIGPKSPLTLEKCLLIFWQQYNKYIVFLLSLENVSIHIRPSNFTDVFALLFLYFNIINKSKLSNLSWKAILWYIQYIVIIRQEELKNY